MILKPITEIRDPVHGYIKITKVEREIIDSPFIQRLRRIHQLAGAYLVFPGAVHTRFEHVLGAMNVAGMITESLSERVELKKEQIQEIRLAALLHDIGHGPFSHLYEEVLTTKTKTTHEDLSQRIILETEIGDILRRNGFSSRNMSEFCVGKGNMRPRYMNEIIAGGLSADIMDYLLRDSYFTGVEFGRVDIHRVIDSLDVVEDHLALDRAAQYNFEALIIARYEMFRTVYFHRTVRAAQLMLVHSMLLADDALQLTNLSEIRDYLEMTDETILQKLVSIRQDSPEVREAKKLASDFRNRKLVKCVFERVMQRRDRFMEQLLERERVRDQVLRDIAERSRVNPIHIYLDVPTTPSIPYTSSREALRTITLVHKEGKKREVQTVQIESLPLIGSISGFVDALRIYTSAEHKKDVFDATMTILGRENFTTRISV